MTVPVSNDRFPLWGGIATWSLAGLAALALHAAVLTWALRRPTEIATETSAPAAVMIELAPVAAAPEEPEQEIASDTFDAPEIALPSKLPKKTDLTPMAVRLPEAAMPPLPDEIVPEPELAHLPEAQPPAEIALARPVARPENLKRISSPPPEPAETQREPTPADRDPSTAATRARVKAPPSDAVAAPQTSRGAVNAAATAKWHTRLLAHLERRKRYPSLARSRGDEGTVFVRFAIDEAGRVLSASIARSSGSASLDQEVLGLVRRASPVPAPPPGAPRDVTAPVQFRIR